MRKDLTVVLLFAVCLFLGGCSYFQRHGFIKAGTATVAGVQDAGNPATLDTSAKGETLALPAGSKVTVTRFEATLDLPARDGLSAQKGQPAREVTEITLAKDTVWQKQESTVKADTGTVDTSIAAKRIDSQESRPLLYAAIASALAAGFFLYRAYPTPAFICGGAAVVFAFAWKAAGLPSWFWAVGAVALAAAAFLYIGHERGQAAVAPPKSP